MLYARPKPAVGDDLFVVDPFVAIAGHVLVRDVPLARDRAEFHVVGHSDLSRKVRQRTLRIRAVRDRR